MKFAEHLAAHITPEWRKQYIHYEVKHSPSLIQVFIMVFPSLNSLVCILCCCTGYETNLVPGNGTSSISRGCRTWSHSKILCKIWWTIFHILWQRVGYDQHLLFWWKSPQFKKINPVSCVVVNIFIWKTCREVCRSNQKVCSPQEWTCCLQKHKRDRWREIQQAGSYTQKKQQTTCHENIRSQVGI